MPKYEFLAECFKGLHLRKAAEFINVFCDSGFTGTVENPRTGHISPLQPNGICDVLLADIRQGDGFSVYVDSDVPPNVLQRLRDIVAEDARPEFFGRPAGAVAEDYRDDPWAMNILREKESRGESLVQSGDWRAK